MYLDQPKTDDSAIERVSVVVPSYNHELYVEQCLNSIIKQTVAPKELIVIDDGSPDGSWAVIEKVLNNCPFPCEFYTRNNRGLCNTLNEGLEKSSGEFFAYLGSDDVWISAFLESRVSTIEKAPEAPLAYGHSFIIDQDTRVIGYSYGHEIERRTRTRDSLLFGFVPTSPSVLYRRAALEKHSWNPEFKLEDFDLYLRLSTEGEFAFDENVLSCWRTHYTNTSQNVELMVEECIKAVERNAPALDLSDAELGAYVRAMQINMVDALLESDERAKAVKVFVRNVRGFANTTEMLKRAAKLAAPKFVIEKRRKLSKQYFQNKKTLGFIDSNFNFIET